MAEDIDHSELFEAFPELTEAYALYEKEVLAHFGLLFSAFADLEAALQMFYIFSGLRTELQTKKISSEAEWTASFDRYEARSFKATFGSLLAMVSDFSTISDLLHELTLLKKYRDYFAHHFFAKKMIKCTLMKRAFFDGKNE